MEDMQSRKLYSTLPNLMALKNPKMTQRYLAQQLGVSPSAINRLYNGQPLTFRLDPQIIEKICNYFNCEVAELLVMKNLE